MCACVKALIVQLKLVLEQLGMEPARGRKKPVRNKSKHGIRVWMKCPKTLRSHSLRRRDQAPCCRKNKRRLLHHLSIKFFSLETSTNMMNYATIICSNILLTIVMQRISKKRKTRTFFGHGYALTYDNCCIAYSCGSSEHKELLSAISRKFRGVSCPEFHLSWCSH